jgi:hypothetical protein
MPAADALIEAYVEALGGRDLYLTVTSFRQVGTVSIMEMGIDGNFEILASSSNQFRSAIDLPGLGQILSGYDGENGWTTNPLIGAAVMQGEELAQARDNADWLGQLRDRELIPVRETVGPAEFAGVSCWRVRLQRASGRESFDCYSRETGLLVAPEETQASPMGTIPSTSLFQEYREVGGWMFPRRVIQSASGQTLQIFISEVELNQVPPSAFAPPPAVAALLGTGGG